MNKLFLYTGWITMQIFGIILNWMVMLNKRPMGHIAHLRKQFKSKNTYDYIITLIKRRKKIINLMRIYWFFIGTNLNALHPRMHCAKFGCNWPSGSGEEDVLISSMYFCYFVIISAWKRAGPFFWTNLNPWIPFTQGCFVQSLVKIGSVILEKILNFINVFSLLCYWITLG